MDIEDMMVDRDMSHDEARDVLADASDSDEDRYERHRERLSDFAEQEREECAVEVVYVGSAGHLRRYKVIDSSGRYLDGGLFRTEAEARAFIADRR